MLVCVVYGDGKTLLCNSDCVSANLLGYVKKQTGNLDCEVVDLADETGRLPAQEIPHSYRLGLYI